MKDTFLRCAMDPEGYVPVSVIATFKRIATVQAEISTIISVGASMLLHSELYQL